MKQSEVLRKAKDVHVFKIPSNMHPSLALAENEGAGGAAGTYTDIVLGMLVTPERTVHAIPDRTALAHFVQIRKLGSKLHGNLRQLLGFDSVGPGRKQRREAGVKG
jgi:hypothetical protein